MSNLDHFIKRAFDLVFALGGLIMLGWFIGAMTILARIDTGRSGLFRQQRVGRHGRMFSIYKLRSMRDVNGVQTNVTTANDPRITRFGGFLRYWKIDELPQLVNVLLGHMSLVGPRPDMPELRGRLLREAPLVLTVRPGIVGPATLKYRNEERLLATQRDPEEYNASVVLPDKMRINEEYIRNYRFRHDVKWMWLTLINFHRSESQYVANQTEQVSIDAA